MSDADREKLREYIRQFESELAQAEPDKDELYSLLSVMREVLDEPE